MMASTKDFSKELTFRSVVDKDSDFIYLLKKMTLKQYVEQTWGSWDEEFQVARHNQVFSPEKFEIIQYEGKDIGVLKTQENDESVEIDIIEILPKYQNKGIGSYIVQNIIDSTSQKHKSVSLQVLKVNTKAVKLYKHLGFSVNSETTTHFLMSFFIKKKK